jgi:Fe-S cluster assembly protein SufD
MMSLLKQSEKLNQRVGEPQAFTLIRSLAAKNFENLSWPSKKMEAWRYSPVQKLQTEFTPQLTSTSSHIDSSRTDSLIVESMSSAITNPHFKTIIIYNGNLFEYSNSQIQRVVNFESNYLNDLYEIKTLKKSLEQSSIDSLSLKSKDDKLEALNLIYFDQGFLLLIKENAQITSPLHLIHIHTSKERNPLFQTRLHITASKGSHATIIETHLMAATEAQDSTSSPHPDFTPWNNSTSRINVEDQAHLTLIQWFETASQRQVTHRTQINLKEKTRFHLLQGAWSEGWTRNETSLTLEGADSEVLMHGIGFSKNSGTVDQPSRIQFFGTNNQFQQIYKNLLLDNSRAIFNGQIMIQPSAQKTNSSQLHQTLLLSSEAEVDTKQAEVNTKPELEIYADDVKATHGATVGQLNPDELFYFQSRGISKEKAHSLMCVGFLSELCDCLPDIEVQNYLKNRISQHWMKEEK